MKKKLFFYFLSGIALVLSLSFNVYFFLGGRVPAVQPCPPASRGAGAPASAPENAFVPAEELAITECYFSNYSRHLVVRFNQHVDWPSLQELLKISPALQLRVYLDPYSGDAYVTADFAPETKYTLTIAAGLRNASGEGTLKHPLLFTFLTPPLPPTAQFLSKSRYFPLHSRNFTLPLQVANCSKLQVRLEKYYENNLNPFTLDTYAARRRLQPVAEAEINLELPKNELINYALDLSCVLPDRTPGVYWLSISPGGEDNYDCNILILTDLAIQATLDEQNQTAAVIIRSLATGQAVPGARISLLSYKNQLVAEGSSGPQGEAILNYLPSYKADDDDYVQSVIAKTDRDISFYQLRDGHSLSSFDNRGESHPRGPQAFVYTERGACRPGEDIQASFFVRQRNGAASAPVINSPCEIILTDPNGSELTRQRLTLDGNGFASLSLPLVDSAGTGAYTITCGLPQGKNFVSWGTASFLVANYVPDRIKVNLLPDQSEARSSDSLSYKLSAHYYFGPPVTAGKYSFVISTTPAAPPPHWEGYQVGDPGEFTGADSSSQLWQELQPGLTLNWDGFQASGGSSYNPVLVVATTSITEPGGRAVSANASTVVHPSEFYLGLRKQTTTRNTPADKTARIELTLLGPRADSRIETAERRFNKKLYAIEWNYVLKKNSRNTYSREWSRSLRAVSRTEVQTFDALSADIYYQDLPDGCYELVVESEDKLCRSKLEFWHWAGEAGSRSADPAILSLATDREVYFPGEQASITFDSPGEGFVFLVCGEISLESVLSFPVKAGKNSVTMPIPAAVLTGNYFAGLTLVCQKPDYNRNFALLCLSINQRQRHHLKLSLAVPAIAVPGTTIDYRLTVHSEDGQPRPAAVHLYAVDEGILSLTAYQTPDIFEFFHGRYYCHFQFSDIYDQIYPDLKIGPDGKIGGGADSSRGRKLEKLSQVAPAIVNLGLLAVPSSGILHGELPLPQHLGAMRLMALASNAEAVGKAEAQIILRDVLSVTGTAPRAVAPGDEFEMSFTAFNHDLPPGPGTLKITLPEKWLRLSEDTFTTSLEKEGSRNCSVKCRIPADAGGAFQVAYEFSQGPAVKRGHLPVTVRPLNPPLTAVTCGIVKPSESKTVCSALGESWPRLDEARIRVLSSPLLGVEQALSWLNEYPYGCLEQITAGAFPFLASDDLLHAGLIDQAQKNSGRQKLHRSIARILSMQTSNGQFTMWPGGYEPWPEASIFASHFLFLAHELQIFTLPWQTAARLQKNLENCANDHSRPRAERGYAMFVCSYNDKNSSKKIARKLLDSGIRDFGDFFAAMTLIRCGQASEGAMHLRRILEKDIWLEQGAPYPLADNASRAGLVLYLLARNMDDPALGLKLALHLQEQLRRDASAWGSTQANAWATLGLAAYGAKFSTRDCQGELRFSDGRRISLAAQPHLELPVDRDAELTLHNDGPGPLYYQLTVSGVPQEMPPLLRQLVLRKTYLNAEQQPVTSARHGELLTVRLEIEAPGPKTSLVFCDLLPGGLEIEDEMLVTRAAAVPPALAQEYNLLRPNYWEKRDDRLLLFADWLEAGQDVFTYRVRAVSRGSFQIPPAHAEAMYTADFSGYSPGKNTFTIR